MASAVDSFHHDVIANPGADDGLPFDSGANAFQRIIFLASTEDPDGVARIPTPLRGGSIDVGNGVTSNIRIVADGIGSTVTPFLDGFFHTGHAVPVHPTNDLTLSLLLPIAFCDRHTAIQSILTDPANAPVFIDNTDCADLRFDGGVAPTNLGLADDGLVTVPFAPGYSFSFHGVVYTEITISANGRVGFGPIAPMSVAFQTSPTTFGSTMTSAYLGGGVITIYNFGGFLTILRCPSGSFVVFWRGLRSSGSDEASDVSFATSRFPRRSRGFRFMLRKPGIDRRQFIRDDAVAGRKRFERRIDAAIHRTFGGGKRFFERDELVALKRYHLSVVMRRGRRR